MEYSVEEKRTNMETDNGKTYIDLPILCKFNFRTKRKIRNYYQQDSIYLKLHYFRQKKCC